MKKQNQHTENGLPKGWKKILIRDMAETQSGGTPSTTNPKYWDGDIAWINSGELKDCIIKSPSKYITKLGLEKSSAKLFPKETVVIALTGATTAKVGLLEISTSTNQSVTGIFPNKTFSSKFLFYQLISLRKKILSNSIGTAQPHINKKIVDSIEIVIPSFSEQVSVVSKIEELFSELDKGIEQLKTAQQQLKIYRQAVLKAAFEGKLTAPLNPPKEGKQVPLSGVEPLTMAAEVETDYKKNNGLPEGWKEVKLNEICIYVSDGDHLPPPKTGKEIPFITISNIVKNKIDFSNTMFMTKEYYQGLKENRKPMKGDILYSVTGSFGIPVLINFEMEFCFQRHIGLIRPKEAINQKWLYYLMQSPQIFNQAKKTATGTAQKTVALKSLRNFSLPFCSQKEQSKIVQEIETRLSVADKMEESINESLQQAEALRQSILKKAFEGRLIQAEANISEKPQAKIIPFERKVLAGKIIHQLHNVGQFGLTKFQKTFFIIENFAEVKYETNFIRERAGPYDKEFTQAFRKEMEEKDWFTEETKVSLTRFVPGENVGSLIGKYLDYFKDKAPKILFVLQQLKDKSLHDSELIATLYAVWNNRIIQKKPIKENELINDFFNWSPEKKEKFDAGEISIMYKWMKKIKLIPRGFGSVIK